MEEIKAMHELSLEWGCITNLMDKIVDIEASLDGGWDELIDMVADAVTEEGGKKDPEGAFFRLYSFLWRLYFRLRNGQQKEPFNKYSLDEKNEKFMVENYDYKTFCWAINKGFTDGISNNYLYIPLKSLSEGQISKLKNRCK